MDNEWKEIKYDLIPTDILTREYEWEVYGQKGWNKSFLPLIEIIDNLDKGHNLYRYRKPEPKAPSHEEIMTKWWFNGSRCDSIWHKVKAYSPENSNGKPSYWLFKDWHNKEWFIGRESATIPPEAE